MEIEINKVSIDKNEIEAVFKIKTSLEERFNMANHRGVDDGMIQQKVFDLLTNRIANEIYDIKLSMVNEKLADKEILSAVLSSVTKKFMRNE